MTNAQLSIDQQQLTAEISDVTVGRKPGSLLRLPSRRWRLFLTQHTVPSVLDEEGPQPIRSRRLSRQIARARHEDADKLCDASIIE
jgi:hypothetical protein